MNIIPKRVKVTFRVFCPGIPGFSFRGSSVSTFIVPGISANHEAMLFCHIFKISHCLAQVQSIACVFKQNKEMVIGQNTTSML